MRFTVHITGDESLGSRREFFRALARRTDRARLADSSWTADPKRLRQMRRALLDSFAYTPPVVTPQVRWTERQRCQGYDRRLGMLRISPDDVTPIVLYQPHAPGRHPALLALHEHGGQYLLGHEKVCALPDQPRVFRAYQQRCYGGQPPADYFASQGFVVLAFDLLGFGSRALWHPQDEPYRTGARAWTAARELAVRLRMRHEQDRLHRALLAFGVSEVQVHLHDAQRALDFLCALPQVDPQRVGVFGLSVGAMLTHYLAALDTRVRAAVPVCWSGDFSPMIEATGPRVLGTAFLWPQWSGKLRVPQWVALSWPRAVLILNGRADPLYSFANQQRTRRQTLALARQQPLPTRERRKRQGKERPRPRVQWRFFAGGHQFHPPQQALALSFLKQELGPTAIDSA